MRWGKRSPRSPVIARLLVVQSPLPWNINGCARLSVITRNDDSGGIFEKIQMAGVSGKGADMNGASVGRWNHEIGQAALAPGIRMQVC